MIGGGDATTSGLSDVVMDRVVRLSSCCGCKPAVFFCTLRSDCSSSGCTFSHVTCSLALLRIACNMLISLFDCSFVALFSPCWHAAMAFMSLSFGETVGFVICLCWNCTVSLSLSLLVDLM